MTETDPAVGRLYADFEAAGLLPLWTQREDLMPGTPAPRAVPHVWRWKDLYPLAERAGQLVPVGRGGERRAIALANPGLAGGAVCHGDAVGGGAVPRPEGSRA